MSTSTIYVVALRELDESEVSAIHDEILHSQNGDAPTPRKRPDVQIIPWQGLSPNRTTLAKIFFWMEANTDGPLWIGVWSGNLKAQKLYAAHGFEKAGEYQYPVGAWMDDEFILRRE